MRQAANRGFTLMELLAVLALAALVWSLAAPGFGQLMQRQLAQANINALVGAIHFTRYQAVTRRQLVTLCPMTTPGPCGDDWHLGLVSFIDRNANGHLEAEDRLLRSFEPLRGGTVVWRSFRRRPWLQMTPLGTTNFQNGNFVYCNDGGDLRYARQLVINLEGRPRQSRDTDRDGLVEDREGRDLVC